MNFVVGLFHLMQTTKNKFPRLSSENLSRQLKYIRVKIIFLGVPLKPNLSTTLDIEFDKTLNKFREEIFYLDEVEQIANTKNIRNEK